MQVEENANQIVLTGQVYRLGETRSNAAGIPIKELWLTHKSNQFNGIADKPVDLIVAVRMAGELATQVEQTVQREAFIKVTGYIDHRPSRDSNKQLCVYANSVTTQDITR